jgi:membrane associated rhomboid family serine protease
MAFQQYRMGGLESIPPVIKNIIIINCLSLLAATLIDQRYENWFTNTFALHYFKSDLFKPWQIVTHMFMHGSLGHLFFNMLGLWMLGSRLEVFWGSKRFLQFYMICGLGASFLHMGAMWYDYKDILALLAEKNMTGTPAENAYLTEQVMHAISTATVGASGAVFGILAAFGYLFPNTELYIYGAIPVKAKYLVLGYAALEIYLGIQNSVGDNVAHWAHIGGALFGLLLVLYWNKNNRKTFY